MAISIGKKRPMRIPAVFAALAVAAATVFVAQPAAAARHPLCNQTPLPSPVSHVAVSNDLHDISGTAPYTNLLVSWKINSNALALRCGATVSGFEFQA